MLIKSAGRVGFDRLAVELKSRRQQGHPGPMTSELSIAMVSEMINEIERPRERCCHISSGARLP